ncbi:MAG: hypothetical protein ACERKN_07200 [Velocimicrobium sp.]
MKTKKMINELRRLEEKHKNDKVFTGEINWSVMCHDVASKLEELSDTQHFEEVLQNIKMVVLETEPRDKYHEKELIGFGKGVEQSINTVRELLG